MKKKSSIMFLVVLSLLFTMPAQIFPCSFVKVSLVATKAKYPNSLTALVSIETVSNQYSDLNILDIIEGDENKTIMRVWDDKDFECNGTWSMGTENLGNQGDTLLVILPKIDSIINPWEVIGDYRMGHLYAYTVFIQIKGGEGYYSGKNIPWGLYSYEQLKAWAVSSTAVINMKNAKPTNNISITHTPFTNQVSIAFPQGTTTYSLHIYNTSGELVKAFEDVSESVTWNTEGQGRGVYYLKANAGSDVVVRKFVLD